MGRVTSVSALAQQNQIIRPESNLILPGGNAGAGAQVNQEHAGETTAGFARGRIMAHKGVLGVGNKIGHSAFNAGTERPLEKARAPMASRRLR